MTSVSRHVRIDKLDDIVNKYNITERLKWNMLVYNQADILTLLEKIMIKVLKLKLAILLEYQKI